MALFDGVALGLAPAARPGDIPAAVADYEHEMFERADAASRESAQMQETPAAPGAARRILAFFTRT
ncbi:hypothetical protein ABH922_002110 [Rhodococcus sp. 27YEA15]|uniref:hypothetical protein n=1 Tax=Rhodococcus sp. 27YEA15 TaxID=3156259 RepID=UPI003C7AD35A